MKSEKSFTKVMAMNMLGKTLKDEKLL